MAIGVLPSAGARGGLGGPAGGAVGDRAGHRLSHPGSAVGAAGCPRVAAALTPPAGAPVRPGGGAHDRRGSSRRPRGRGRRGHGPSPSRSHAGRVPAPQPARATCPRTRCGNTSGGAFTASPSWRWVLLVALGAIELDRAPGGSRRASPSDQGGACRPSEGGRVRDGPRRLRGLREWDHAEPRPPGRRRSGGRHQHPHPVPPLVNGRGLRQSRRQRPHQRRRPSVLAYDADAAAGAARQPSLVTRLTGHRPSGRVVVTGAASTRKLVAGLHLSSSAGALGDACTAPGAGWPAVGSADNPGSLDPLAARLVRPAHWR